MSNPTCSQATLLPGCFRGQTLNNHQKTALRVYFNVLELAAIGGTNYTNALTSTLLTDTNSLLEKVCAEDLMTAETAIAYNNALSAGATPSSNIQTLMGNIKCLTLFNDEMLAKMEVLLACKLGRHKSYPQ